MPDDSSGERNENYTKLLRTQNRQDVPNRVNWKVYFEKAQRVYDRKWMRLRRIQNLRSKVYEVRRQLQESGINQNSLLRGRNALNVKGVIYAIWSPLTPLIYVGQTINSSLHRFKQHVHTSKNGTTPLAHQMRLYGYRNFLVFPLEVIKRDYQKVKSDRLTHFRKHALMRENYWIERLQSYVPRGLNVKSSSRNRTRRHRSNNPMTWARKKRSNVVNSVKKQVHSTCRWFAFRDYHRRCGFLVQKYETGQLDSIVLDSYRKAILWRMLLVVESAEHAFQAASAEAVAMKLREFLVIRNTPKRKRSKNVCPIIVEWQGRAMRSIQLRSILEMEKHKALFPDTWPEVVISKRLPPTIANTIFNFTKVAKDMKTSGTKVCPCNGLFPKKYRSLGNCVYTGDISIVRHNDLRTILQYGANFRTRVADPDLVTAIENGLNSFITVQSIKLGLDKSAFEAWKMMVLNTVRTRFATATQQSHGMEFTKSAHKYLRFLQNYLVLSPTDKAARNVSFICKRLYVTEILKNEFINSGAYLEVKTPEMDIIQEHRNFLSPKGLFGKEKFGYVYAIPKFHKSTPKQRFIAGLANCTTTLCSKTLTKVLTCVLKSLRDKDDFSILLSGVRRFFVVNGFEEPAEFLPRVRSIHNSSKWCPLYTGDFSTMYTTIPHSDLIEKLDSCVNEAVVWEATIRGVDKEKIRFVIEDGECTYGVRSPRSKDVFKKQTTVCMDTVKELIQFLVKNTFVKNGGILRQQVVGIPMGTNCAPLLANLYLYAYESTFIDRLVKSQGVEVARHFHMTFRLIDDLLSADNPRFEEFASIPVQADGKGGIYPSALVLNKTSITNTKVNFVGMTISWPRDGNISLDFFDKRAEFPVQVIRYPDLCSVIPTHPPYGSFTGGLHRIYKIRNNVTIFLDRCVEFSDNVLKKVVPNNVYGNCSRGFFVYKTLCDA